MVGTAGVMFTKAVTLAPAAACAPSKVRTQHTRPSICRLVGDVRGVAHTQLCGCLPAATEVYPDGSDYVDLAEFGLEGMARAAPGGSTGAPQMDARIRIRKQGHCYGCGVRLQAREPSAVGYVDPVKFNEKLIHRQTDKLLCVRCNELCHGKMVPAVEDFAQKGAAFGGSAEALTLNGKALISPEDLRRQLLEVGSKKALVLMLVDLLDVSGTLMTKVRDLVGRNPIILVGTKMDLLPTGCQPKAVAQWLLDAAMRKRLNVVSAHLVSSHTMEGISAVASKACAERKGRDVYVIGAANVGKSAFVRAFLNELCSFQSRNFDAAALGSGKYLPIESAMPGTTLGLIPLQAFASGGTIFDSPGVHLHHRIPHMLSPEELKLLHPRKRLCVYRPPSPADIVEAASDGAGNVTDGPGPVSATYEWSDLVRVDVLQGPPSLVLVFHGPHSMQVSHGPLQSEPPRHDLLSQPKVTSRPKGPKKVLSCAKSVALRGGLVPHDLQMPVMGGAEQAVADIAVSGLPGWVTLWASHSRDEIKLRVWAVRGVEVFLRPPFPTQLPEQLEDDITTTAADNRSGRAGKSGIAAEVDTRERVKQIFRRYQVEEVKEEDDGTNANELLALLKKEVEELETVAPGPESVEEDINLTVSGPSVHRTTTARNKTGRATASSKDDLSALFGSVLDESAPESTNRFTNISRKSISEKLTSFPNQTSSSTGSRASYSGRAGTDRDAGRARGGAHRGSEGAFEEEFGNIYLGGQAVQQGKRPGHDDRSAEPSVSDLSSLFGAALEDSIPAMKSKSSPDNAPMNRQTRIEETGVEAFDAFPEPAAVSTSSFMSKSRSRARQMADEQATARGPYDRPQLFPESSFLSEHVEISPEPAAVSTASSGVSVSDLAAKYTALSRSSDGAGAGAGPAAAGQSGEAKSAVEEETFVFDEDLVKEIAAQAKAGAKRRRRAKPAV